MTPRRAARVLSEGLGGLFDASVDSIELAVLVTSFVAQMQRGCGTVLILVGPQRWQPPRRGRLVDSIRELGAALGTCIDVYPIRPSDITGQSVSRNAAIARWMEIGTPIYGRGRS
jgi:hypothetical protein